MNTYKVRIRNPQTKKLETSMVEAKSPYQAESKAQLSMIGRFPNAMVDWPTSSTLISEGSAQ